MPVVAVVAAAALAGAPFGLEVNRHRWSADEVADEVRATGSEPAAIRALAVRALLLQEARAFGHPTDGDPARAAAAFLERLYPAETVCARLTDRDLERTYQSLRSRYDHPALVTLAELVWDCGAGDAESPALACTAEAHTHAWTRWAPLAAEVRDADDLRWLAASSPGAPLGYAEVPWAADALLERTRRELSVPQPEALAPGVAWVTLYPGGARLRVVTEAEPARHTDLTDPATRAEVRARVCETRLTAARRQYVDGLLGSALIRKLP